MFEMFVKDVCQTTSMIPLHDTYDCYLPDQFFAKQLLDSGGFLKSSAYLSLETSVMDSIFM